MVAGQRAGTLAVPRDSDPGSVSALERRVVPSLETLLTAARERQGLEAQVIETRALRRANVVKTALLRSVSHDLRSPLTAITAAAAGLRSTTLDAEAREELIAVIATESGRLTRLVDNLLDLSRLQAGQLEPRADWSSAEELIDAAVAAVAAPPGGFEISVEPDLAMFEVDAGQLERALANVIENAARYAAEAPVTISAQRIGGHVAIRVADRGPGIAREELERIFEPFHTVGRARRRDRARPGDRPRLRRGQRRHPAGTVAARPGRQLHDSAAGERAAGEPERVGGGRKPMSARPRVLICDDEPQILRALRVILGDGGFEVVPAMSVREALDAVAVRPPDAAIVDLVLPDGDGVEVVGSIREWSRMPIIVLSAVGDEREKVRALDAGADDYVTKPFGPEELVARLRAALRRSRPGVERAGGRDRGLVIDLRGTANQPRGRGHPPDADRVRPAAPPGAQPRPVAHPQGPAERGLGPGLSERHPGAAGPHRQPATKDRDRPGLAAADPHRSGDRLPLRSLKGRS